MPNFRIQIDEKQLQREIQKELKAVVNRSIPRLRANLNTALKQILHKRFSEGIPPIAGTELNEIGVPDINDRMMRIIDVAAESFEVKVTPANLLRIDIGVLRQDYSELLALPEAVFPYISNKGGGVLHWLDWILIRGNEPLIDGFRFSPINSQFSRTNGGLMVRGGTWNVPDSLAGTPNDNLLTRALTNIKGDLERVVKKELQTQLR